MQNLPPVQSAFPAATLKTEFPAVQRRARKRQAAVALVLVLAFIALCTVLVVAFFANVTTQGISENAAAGEHSAEQLAGSAVQLVEGTITYATEPNANKNNGDTTFAWACQPGMIRTYGTGSAASANPLAYYKLYSSDNMILSGTNCDAFTSSNTANPDVPDFWDNAPSLFADLNAPLVKQTISGSTTGTTIFPIVDPRAVDLNVEGFRYTQNLDAPLNTKVDGISYWTGNYAKDSGIRLPMPVKWMYVLKDGTMTVPDTPTSASLQSSGGKVTSVSWSNNVPVNMTPSATNPVVGRVAFWTDDESEKLNVNTASEGTYWDTIVANSGSSPYGGNPPQPIPTPAPQPAGSNIPDYTQAMGDIPLALIPPAQHEYQRYPGHPATTCLSTVLGGALATYSATTRASFVKAFTDAIPRVTDLGTTTTTSGTSSMGGTQAAQPGGGGPTVGLVTDLDRLYASLDEFRFLPNRTVQSLATSNSTTLLEDVDTCRFFLTAHSKAPELNLFGLPRVAIWPIWSIPTNRTAFEQEMLRCATIDSTNDPHQMIFQRANPLDPSLDWSGITRNQQVYGYLQSLTNRPVPGFGGQFNRQYGQLNTDQILTEIFDYIRCINLSDNSVPSNGASAVPFTGTVANGKIGEVVPITITSAPNGDGLTTHGLGRIPLISELALVLVKLDDRKNTTIAESGNLAQTITVTGAASLQCSPSNQTLVEWALIPKLDCPMAGYVALGNNLRIKFSSVNLSIGGQTTSGPYSDMYDVGRVSSGRDSVMGGVIGLEALVESDKGAPSDSCYPTGLVVLNGTSGSPIQGGISGTVTVQVYAPNPPGGNVAGATPLQTLSFNFASPPPTGGSIPAPIPSFVGTSWGGTFRMPASGYSNTALGNQGTSTPTVTYPAYNTKNGGRESSTAYLINGSSTSSVDVVRSLVPTGTIGGSTAALAGDLRLLALEQNSPTGTATPVPSTAFQLTYIGPTNGVPVPSGGMPGTVPTAATYAADFLRDSTVVRQGGFGWGALSAAFVPGKFDVITAPEVPPQPTGTTSVPFPGDWDNGTGLVPDGPWANKPDEGVAGLPDKGGGDVPYIGSYTSMAASTQQAQTLFSPNRQISSPVMFGSLPAGWAAPTATTPAQSWRTLLFRPATLLSAVNPHPGGNTPSIRDHLLLDLFWMPVVEPYGISEPFATSGKINLNSQIMPFSYITRTSGLRAVLKSVMLTALNPSTSGDSFASSYKHSVPGASSDVSGLSNPGDLTRYPIDREATLGEFTTNSSQNSSPSDNTNAFPEFGRGTHTLTAPNFFVSASQICDLPLVPQGTSAANVTSFWQLNSMTGDNSLERPYSLIYPRVTTKSNIFTVHVLAQSLKQVPADAAAVPPVWNEIKDQVVSEFRGSFTIEKYFDPNTDDLTDSGGNPLMAASDGNISPTAGLRTTKWRLLGMKRFGQ